MIPTIDCGTYSWRKYHEGAVMLMFVADARDKEKDGLSVRKAAW
jgi:hypothetical protein